jgi:predicted dehydrogenase
MFHLTVIGGQETRWQAVAARLRGVVLNAAEETQDPATIESGGAAFIGSLKGEGAAIERWLDRGKAVLMTADSCPSRVQLQSLFARAKQSQAPLVVVNRERYAPSRQLIRQQLDGGKLGEPGLIRLHHWQRPDTAEVCQGLSTALLCDLDLVAWLFGKSPNLVYAVEQTAPGSSERLGVQVHLGFPEGGMALVDSTAHTNVACCYRSLTVISSSGAAYADDQQNVQLVMQQGDARWVAADEGLQQWVTLIQEFAAEVQNSAQRPAYPTSWHNALVIGDAVRQSLQSRQAVVPVHLM